jgi:chitodextrinase
MKRIVIVLWLAIVLAGCGATNGFACKPVALSQLGVRCGNAFAVKHTREISEVTWDFGDGQTATGAEVIHTYTQAGKYKVTMKVTYRSGNEESIPDYITVPLE